MDEFEKEIAGLWCLRVGFSQQPDRADLLLSRLMYHVLNEPAMEMVSCIVTVLSIKLSIGSKPSQIYMDHCLKYSSSTLARMSTAVFMTSFCRKVRNWST